MFGWCWKEWTRWKGLNLRASSNIGQRRAAPKESVFPLGKGVGNKDTDELGQIV